MKVTDNARHEHTNSHERDVRKQIASDELRVARERLTADLQGAFSAFKRFVFVERKALGLVVFDSGYRVACFAALGLCALLTMLVATLLMLVSLRQGLQSWTGGAWWSDLVLGVALIGSLAGVAHFVRRSVHRSTLATTRRALEESSPAKSSSAPGEAA